MPPMLSLKPTIKPTSPALDANGDDTLQRDDVPTPQTLAAWASQFGPGSDFGLDALVSGISGAAATSPAGTASAATGTVPPTGPTTGTAAAPTWVASLHDAVLKTDMTTASAGGTVSEAGMARLFSDLAAELSANHTTLSASQLGDLQTIAADLNVGETASSYVTYITDALIDGNTANTDWTGGAASSTPLGNLAAGCTATQLNELDGKWFLGTDLPTSSVNMSGYSPFSVSYTAVTNPLFGSSGPSMNDINQGFLGDCYLLASLAEVARQNPSLIRSMITDNGNNTYGVRFFVNGSAEYVTVNNYLANGGTEFNYATDIWASLVEKAYAQIQDSGTITGNSSFSYGNSFSTIGNGGWPANTLAEITGASTIINFAANGSSWSKYAYDNAMTFQSGAYGLTTSSVLSTLVADLAAGNDVVLSSYSNAVDSAGRTTLVSNHAMSIYGYDSATGNLEIRNPWGTTSWQSWDTTFEVSLGTLLAAGDWISVDNMTSSSGSVVSNALVSAAAGLQANATVTSFTILDTPGNVARSIDALNGDTKLTSIALTNGNPLPITYAQLIADTSALSKLPVTYSLAVGGVTVANATSVQINTHVASFAVTDTAANVTATLSALTADTKLSALSLSGTAAADTLNLTGLKAAATIFLNGDTARVSHGLTAPSLTFIGSPDAITLGTGASTIAYTLKPASGIETITNFQYGLDQLNINLNGAANTVLGAASTTYNGANAIALYSSADPTHGVVLTNVSSGMTAADLLAHHLTFSAGHALIG